MYNVNWQMIVRIFVPSFLRKQAFLQWMDCWFSQIKSLHTIFLAFQNEIFLRIAYTGQVIYMEKRLNDKWDNINRGIYIQTLNFALRFYINRKIEYKPPVYLYRKWDVLRTYSPGEYATAGVSVYKAVSSNTGVDPTTGAPDWIVIGPRPYLLRRSEINSQLDFIVWVPSTVVFDNNEMKALINYYKLAGKQYSINIY